MHLSHLPSVIVGFLMHLSNADVSGGGLTYLFSDLEETTYHSLNVSFIELEYVIMKVSLFSETWTVVLWMSHNGEVHGDQSSGSLIPKDFH